MLKKTLQIRAEQEQHGDKEEPCQKRIENIVRVSERRVRKVVWSISDQAV